MRPEPKLTPAELLNMILMLLGMVGVVSYISYTADVKPHEDFITSQNNKVLNKAHKEAQRSVDTLDLTKYHVDIESATKDSARLTEQMRNWMNHQGENPRFCDYKEVYDTVYMRKKGQNQTIGYCLSKFPWQINTDKAIKDPYFAKTYDQYVRIIQNLEIARRQKQ